MLEWRNQAPDDKIIGRLALSFREPELSSSANVVLVFTQFVGMGRILGRVLQKENIDFLYFFGEMKEDMRKKAVNAFNTRPEIGVMVISRTLAATCS
jgi:SNF2 family DNA or RNA helicase